MTQKNSLHFYHLVQRILKWSLAVFFQKIELRHGENIPDSGPVIFVANHPDSTMDALVMSTVTKRVLHNIGHSGLFVNRVKAWFLRNCGVIPVTRRSSKKDDADRNIEAFQACFEALEKGEAISIFPEGISEISRRVKKIKTGAARIALGAEKRNDYSLGIKVIPIGLHFFSRSRFRSRALVNVGRPIDLNPYFALNERDNVEAVNQLTAQIKKNLEQLTVNIRHTELEKLILDIEHIYRDELMREFSESRKPSQIHIAEFVIEQKIADCVEYYYKNDPQKVHKIQEEIASYQRKLRRLHLKDEMLREKTSFPQLLKTEVKGFTKAIIGLPFAVYGAINNYLPFALSKRIAKRYLHERTKILTALFLGGGIIFILFYSFQVSLAWYFGGFIWAGLYLISLPLSGLFSLAYSKRMEEERQRISFSFFIFTKRHLIGKMRYTRKKLVSKLNDAKEEYLSLIDSPSRENSE